MCKPLTGLIIRLAFENSFVGDNTIYLNILNGVRFYRSSVSSISGEATKDLCLLLCLLEQKLEVVLNASCSLKVLVKDNTMLKMLEFMSKLCLIYFRKVDKRSSMSS